MSLNNGDHDDVGGGEKFINFIIGRDIGINFIFVLKTFHVDTKRIFIRRLVL